MLASIRAARRSKTADSAIANIPVCMAVNVFFGLGLSWIIAIIYYESKKETYYVDATTIGLSALMILIFSGVTFIWVIFKRLITGGELGGSIFMKILTVLFLAVMWILFIVLSGIKAYDKL